MLPGHGVGRGYIPTRKEAAYCSAVWLKPQGMMGEKVSEASGESFKRKKY